MVPYRLHGCSQSQLKSPKLEREGGRNDTELNVVGELIGKEGT